MPTRNTPSKNEPNHEDKRGARIRWAEANASHCHAADRGGTRKPRTAHAEKTNKKKATEGKRNMPTRKDATIEDADKKNQQQGAERNKASEERREHANAGTDQKGPKPTPTLQKPQMKTPRKQKQQHQLQETDKQKNQQKLRKMNYLQVPAGAERTRKRTTQEEKADGEDRGRQQVTSKDRKLNSKK